MTGERVLRVLVVDDHPVVRLGLAAVLDGSDGLGMAAAVDTGEAAIVAARDLRPHVVVLDLNLPGIDGIATLRQLLADDPDVAVLVLTMDGTAAPVAAALGAGARGFLRKGATHDEIAAAIRSVAAGSTVLGDTVLESLTAARGASTPAALGELTEREVQVLALVARGAGNAEIGRRLFITDKTVRNHVTNIFAKLGVSSRAEAVARARDAGLGSA